MKKLFALASVLLTLSVNSSANEVYDSSTAESIKSLYWLNKNNDSAIIYGRFDGFKQIKAFINQTLLTGQTVKPFELASKNVDELILMLPSKNKLLKVAFINSHLIYDKNYYPVDPNIIARFREVNNYRIAKGDSITAGSLKLAKKAFGNVAIK